MADLNRDATIDFMPEIAACLKEEALASTAVGVLANLCNNYGRLYFPGYHSNDR
jgi:hypothetical protein